MKCAYLCPPHLHYCAKERGHKGDCRCSIRTCWFLRLLEKLRWKFT